LAGSRKLSGRILLGEITFEVSDSDGLIDESIDGPLHTLNITSNELPLVEGAQYAIKHGRCVLSCVQLPHEQGTVTIVACHTSYPDLQIKIQYQLLVRFLAFLCQCFKCTAEF
jgi:hypothetical protein